MKNQIKTLWQKLTYVVLTMVTVIHLGGCAMAAGDLGAMAASAAGVPQMNAFLPNKNSVPAMQPSSIDGIWTISSIGKKIRIEGGRAYAIDGWLHAFTLKVQPDMVVSKNIQASGRGQFVADDLPLMAKANYEIQSNAQINVVASTLMGPARWALIPVSLDNPRRYQRELQKLGFPRTNLPQTPTSYLASRDQYDPSDDEYEYDDYEDEDEEEYEYDYEN